MIEAVMLWNEPNNLSHWNFRIDPEWKGFAEMAKAAARAIRAINPELRIVLGGISPIDPHFIELLTEHGLIDEVDVVAVHGFPLDWNHWKIDEWPKKIAEIRAVTRKPVWVSEAGASSFGAEEVQVFGLRRTAQLLLGEVERVHWYSLHDLPSTWTATTRHKEAEGSAYYRHYYMGLLREDGSPKLAVEHFPPKMGICQWFHFQDHRLASSVNWFRQLGVRCVRTGVSWADWFRADSGQWFDAQMSALDEFAVTMTLCFTPEHLGIERHYTSPPRDPRSFADFAAWAVERYAPSGSSFIGEGRPGRAAGLPQSLQGLSVGAQ
ncbi:MAG TPA: beta-xylosidase [Candidatus Binatia bacterium]|nr:beta-xylosidase [Candidatus Binatia bacterium]